MPQPVIARYLTQDTYDGFKEVTTIFRHDFVQYMGMLHSWMTLIEAEVNEAPAHLYPSAESMRDFRQLTAELADQVAQTFQQTTAQLRPALPPIRVQTEADVVAYVCKAWDQFFTDFVAGTLPQLQTLEKATRQFTDRPEFEAVVETRLAPAAQEPIKGLLLRAYERTQSLLDPHTFDQRAAEALSLRPGHNTTTAAT
jgi:hypothetical protein